MSGVLDLLRSLRRGDSARTTGATQGPGPRVVVAVTAVQLALTFPMWVRRRKWTFTYVDDTTIRQRQSIDFRFPQPEQFGKLAPAPGDEILVPLWISNKTPLNDLDIFDEEGRTMSMRNQRENGEVAALGIEVALLGLAAKRRIEIRASHRKPLSTLVKRILTEPPSAAEDLLEQALERGLPGRILTENDEHRALLTDLARGFMVLVPVAYEPGRSRVLKLSHQTPLFWTGRDKVPRLRRCWRTALASIGWADKEQVFDERAIGWAEGTHFQIEAPQDVEIGAAQLDAMQYSEAHGKVLDLKRRRVVFDQPTASLNVSVLSGLDPEIAPIDAHAASSDRAQAQRQAILRARADTASLVVRLRPPPRGTFAAATLLAFLSAVLLHFVSAALPELDGQTSSAVLLLVPAVLAAHLARPGEHAFLARLLGGVRLLALGCGLCTLCVAALIGAGSIRVVQRAAVPDPTLCTVTSTIARPAAPQATSTSTTRSERIRRISCQPPLPPQPPDARASASAQLWADIAAWVATALASLLVVGFGRTLAADLRCRNREDHVEPLPQS